MTEVPLLTPEDAATVIRTAFGDRPWQKRARDGFRARDVVSALWVARRECGSEKLRDILRWARQMEGKSDLHRR